MTYAADRLYEEVAYVAYHFHWSLDEILDLEHADRQRFVAEIGSINDASAKRSSPQCGCLGHFDDPNDRRSRACADDEPRAGTARPESGAWRFLPALTETVGPPPLVAPTAPFAANLGAGTPPPPALRQLAHDRGLDAPKGLVAGMARPSRPRGRATGCSSRKAAPAPPAGSQLDEPTTLNPT